MVLTKKLAFFHLKVNILMLSSSCSVKFRVKKKVTDEAEHPAFCNGTSIEHMDGKEAAAGWQGGLAAVLLLLFSLTLSIYISQSTLFHPNPPRIPISLLSSYHIFYLSSKHFVCPCKIFNQPSSTSLSTNISISPCYPYQFFRSLNHTIFLSVSVSTSF